VIAMDKSALCQCLIDDIKDDIEFDSDIIALESLLLTLLDYDIRCSFNSWKYIVLKYDIKNLNKELDFIPIIKNYPERLMNKIGVESFFNYMRGIPDFKVKIIYESIFNVYNPECFIYQSLSYYIKRNSKAEERNLIKNILDRSSYFSKMFFDKTELIKRVVILHIENNSIPLDYLKELINTIDNKKERAVLKTLLIDYFLL